jgi:hypothetical protein
MEITDHQFTDFFFFFKKIIFFLLAYIFFFLHLQILTEEMSEQFFQSLSQNLIEILDDNEYYDITIEVGEDPNVKTFRAHMIILQYRSPFLRRTLSSSKKNDNNVLAHIKFSNISPEIFQIILK